MPEKILVAESDAHTSMTVAHVLEQDGFDVHVVGDVQAAVSAVRANRPVAAVISANLSGGGGTEVIASLRRAAHTAAVPVVGLATGTGDARLIVATGAQASVFHPVDPGALLRAVDAALQDTPRTTVAPETALATAERKDAVHRSRLLDTPPAQIFDRYTRLIGNLLDAPTALFTVITADRQFCKSSAGLATPLRLRSETPLEYSFCQWVVSDDSMLIVDDAREHPVLRHNRAVRELGVVAYCGAPITDRFGVNVGALCAMDDRPHSWTSEDAVMLGDLARSLAADLELHRLRIGA